MVLDKFEDDNVEVVFVYLPVWEMFFSMHVLADSEHHLYRRRWAKRISEKEPDLVKSIIDLNEATAKWLFVIDGPKWSQMRQMEIEELISNLQKMNIYQWNDMIEYTGQRMEIDGRDAVIRVIKEYYE